MTHVVGEEADAAVKMLAVVPARELSHPVLRLGLGRKALRRPVGPVFAGAEQRPGERVVVADTRSAVGRHDAEAFERRLHGRPFHRAAVVGVQHQGTRGASFPPDRPLNQFGGQLCALPIMDFPAHDPAAEDVHP